MRTTFTVEVEVGSHEEVEEPIASKRATAM